MSLNTVEAKHRKSELKTGIHLVEISDMFYLRNALKEVIKINGHPSIIIQYKSKEGICEQMYLMDKGQRQKYFTEALINAKCPQGEGGTFKKENCIHKKLYIAIQEVWHVNDDVVIMEDGIPVIEYRVFKTMPINEGFPPKIKGDPALNNGFAQDEFKTYRNTSTGFIDIKKEDEPPEFITE